MRFDHPAIGWDPVALCENQPIAANNLAPRDSQAHAASDDKRARTCKIAQRLERPLASRFLDDGDTDRKPREQGEDQCFPHIAEREIDETAGYKQRKHRLAQDIDQYARGRSRSAMRELVWTLGSEPRLCLLFAETSVCRVVGLGRGIGTVRFWLPLNHGRRTPNIALAGQRVKRWFPGACPATFGRELAAE